jgi:hypothetical protein
VIRAVSVGLVYFLLVFAAGFGLGIVRTLVLVPRVGPLIATLIEAPVMLGIGYAACHLVLRRWPVQTGRWPMVPVFPILLALFEWQLGLWLFGIAAAQQWANLATPVGLVGLSAQTLVALVPLVIDRPVVNSPKNRAPQSPAPACPAPSRPPL